MTIERPFDSLICMPAARYTPISTAELRELGRGQTDPTIRKLLIEVKRLRAVESRAAQIFAMYKDGYYKSHHSLGDIVMRCLEDALKGNGP